MKSYICPERIRASAFLRLAFALLVTGVARAQTTQPIDPTSIDGASALGQLSVVELGPNYRICADTNLNLEPGQLSPLGGTQAPKPQPRHNRVELATGMNFFNAASGKFEPSMPQFSPSADGTAFVADRVQHRLRVNGEIRSEEHTSELQSLRHLVCRLLLEK